MKNQLTLNLTESGGQLSADRSEGVPWCWGGARETITCMLDIHAKHACASHSLCSHSHKGEVGRGGQAFKAAGRESTQTADDLGGEDKLRCLGGATIHRNIART